MESNHEIGYSLKTFTKKFKLPRLVRVVSGIYDMLDEISLSNEEILTLRTLKKYETVKASNDEGHTFYLPLNITSKVAVISSELNESSGKCYEDVETLADDFPPLVASTHTHNWLEIDEGDILKPIQTWITSPKKGYLQCAILNKPLNDDVYIPLSYSAKFEKLENTNHNSLYLKEVVSNYPLPVQIRFLENRVIIQKHDINSGRPTSMDTLGVITLHGQSDISLVVATTMDPHSGKVHSLLNLPLDLDITVMPYPGSPKIHKKNNRLLELEFCDKNFVYGSTIIEEKEIEDPGAHGYEDVLPRLFPRKSPGAPSRFKHKYPFVKSKAELHNQDDSDELSCQGSHGDGFYDNSSEDNSKTECDSDFVDSAYPESQYSSDSKDDFESVLNGDTTEAVSVEGISKKLNSKSESMKDPNKEGYLDMDDCVDVVKELAKFKASIKYHYRPYQGHGKTSHEDTTSKDTVSVAVGTSELDDDRTEHSTISDDQDAIDKYVEMKNRTLQSIQYQAEVKNDERKPRECTLKSVGVCTTDDGDDTDDDVYDDDDNDDDRYAVKRSMKLTVALTFNGNADHDGDDDVVDDDDNKRDSSDSSVRNIRNGNYDRQTADDTNDDSDVTNAAGSTVNKMCTESAYQSLNTLTMASRETRLSTLKRLKEQHYSLGGTASNNLESLHMSLHRERPRSDLEGYTIPTRSQSVSGGHESPRTFMRSRTLTDSFLHCAEDDDDDGEEPCALRVIKDDKTTSISVNVPDGYQKYMYRKPAPTPPHYNTLPTKLSNKSKQKNPKKGSLKKLAIFARKGLKRSQSATDVDNYSYTYVESVSNSGADKKTDIGKIWDLRKTFGKRNKRGESTEVSRDELQETHRVRLRTLDVDEVCELLQTLSLHRYVENFKKEKIDGSMLVDLTDKMMKELQVDKELDRRKIHKAIDEGWLPNCKENY